MVLNITPWIDLWFRGRRTAGATVQPAVPALDGELPCEPEKPWGCGWFDSSLDLRQGLAVIEHTAIDLALMQAVDRLLRPELANP